MWVALSFLNHLIATPLFFCCIFQKIFYLKRYKSVI